MANSGDPDETARYEPSHLDLHCLQRYLYWSARMKRLKSDKKYGKKSRLQLTQKLGLCSEPCEIDPLLIHKK